MQTAKVDSPYFSNGMFRQDCANLIDALAAETMRAAELMRESRMVQVFGPDPRKAHGRVA